MVMYDMQVSLSEINEKDYDILLNTDLADGDQIDVIIYIQSNDVIFIREINFSNNTSLSNTKLRSYISQSEYSYLDETNIDFDEKRLTTQSNLFKKVCLSLPS